MTFFRQSSVSEPFFQYHCDIDFLENFQDIIVFYNY